MIDVTGNSVLLCPNSEGPYDVSIARRPFWIVQHRLNANFAASNLLGLQRQLRVSRWLAVFAS